MVLSPGESSRAHNGIKEMFGLGLEGVGFGGLNALPVDFEDLRELILAERCRVDGLYQVLQEDVLLATVT